MNRNVSLLASALILSAGLAGCQTGSSGGKNPGNTYSGFWGGGRRAPDTSAPAAAPAPKADAAPAAKPAAAAKPAPAPAPVASEGGMSKTMMYLPTGNASTSTILVERMMPAEVTAGQNFDYIYRVTNLTGNPVSSVVLRDETSMNIVSTNPAANSTSPLLWNLGDLGPNQSKTVTVTGKAAGAGSIGSCANVTWAQVLCQQVAVVQPALKVELTQSAEATPCDPVNATIKVCNTGSGQARNVKVTYNMPAGWSTTDGRSGTVVLDAGTLAAGQCRDFPIAAKASKTGQNCGTASATADGGLTAASQQACTVVRQPVLTLKAECPKPTLMGRNLAFKFTVANTGDAACNATVSVPLPAGTRFVSADNGGTAGANGVSWTGSLAPNATKTLTMVVQSSPTTAGTVTVSASANCACSQPATATCSVTTEGAPDIGIRLEDDNGVVQVGENHIFRYEVKNQGQVDLTNVTLVAKFDPGLDFVSSTFSGPAPAAGSTMTFKLGTLKVGQVMKFDIVGKGKQAGKLLLVTQTSSDQTKTVGADEHVNYVEP